MEWVNWANRNRKEKSFWFYSKRWNWYQPFVLLILASFSSTYVNVTNGEILFFITLKLINNKQYKRCRKLDFSKLKMHMSKDRDNSGTFFKKWTSIATFTATQEANFSVVISCTSMHMHIMILNINYKYFLSLYPKTPHSIHFICHDKSVRCSVLFLGKRILLKEISRRSWDWFSN